MTQVIYQPLVGYNELLKTIDNGGFYEVKQAVRLLTAFFAYFTHLNACVLLFCDLTRIALEMKAMKDLHHEHICRLYQIIETNEYYFLILEYFCNGELFNYIINRNHLFEEEARHFFRQIVSVVAYMH
ncbi:unnamed protein product, partial [Rotaria socialis]